MYRGHVELQTLAVSFISGYGKYSRHLEELIAINLRLCSFSNVDQFVVVDRHMHAYSGAWQAHRYFGLAN